MYVYPEFTNSTVNHPKQFGMLLGATLCQMSGLYAVHKASHVYDT